MTDEGLGAAGGGAVAQRDCLPSGVAEVMTDPDSLNYLVPLALLFASLGQTLLAVLEAFRTGGGVPYAAYGAYLRVAIARLNRPMFLHQLAADWIPALPDIEARLRQTVGPARVADLGCGWSAALPARRAHRAGLGRNRHGHATGDPAPLRGCRRVRRDHRIADRARLLAVLPPRPLTIHADPCRRLDDE